MAWWFNRPGGMWPWCRYSLRTSRQSAPFNTQSYNRYSYVLNNPMNYVDPSGYSWLSDNWRSIAAIAVSFYMPGAYAALLGVTETGLTAAILTGMTAGAIQTGTLKGALMGGFSAGMFHGIGSFFDGAGKGAGDWAFKNKSKGILNTTGRVAKIAAHAAAGGVMSVLQGGKFGHGFVSAGFGEALSPAVGKIDSRLGKYAAGVVIGGTTSALSGGKFGNGAMTAAFQWAFNHKAHPPESADIVVGFDGAGADDLPDNLAIKKLGEELGAQVFDAKAIVGADVGAACDYVMEQLKLNPGGRVYIFGYSAGGNAAIDLANRLAKVGVPVQGLVTFDPHHHRRAFGAGRYELNHNTARAVNFYQTGANPFKGGTIENDSFIRNPNRDLTGSATHIDIVRYTMRHHRSEVLDVLGR